MPSRRRAALLGAAAVTAFTLGAGPAHADDTFGWTATGNPGTTTCDTNTVVGSPATPTGA